MDDITLLSMLTKSDNIDVFDTNMHYYVRNEPVTITVGKNMRDIRCWVGDDCTPIAKEYHPLTFKFVEDNILQLQMRNL